jgi:hypothetical protein
VPGGAGAAGIEDRFLQPLSKGTLGPISREAYLRFAELGGDEESFIEFANSHGHLGFAKTHFHSDETDLEWAECLSEWFSEWVGFAETLAAWEAREIQDLEGVRKFIDSELPGLGTLTQRRVFDVGLQGIVQRINRKLLPEHTIKAARCFLPSCRMLQPQHLANRTAHIEYRLDVRQNTGRLIVKSTLRPTSLISAMWLQLAEVVEGLRVIHRCQECGRWMDLSETARPRAKRMHEHCSLAARMRRYRKCMKARTDPNAKTKTRK